MKTKLLGAAIALALAATPLASIAGGVGGGNANSSWTIYGWQNYSWENVDIDGASFGQPYEPGLGRFTTESVAGAERKFDRIQGNAANIGFSASLDTGVSVGGQAVKANLQCEQFTFHNRLTSSGWCNRNSKLSLSGAFGEIMVGQWLLPFNEMVAQWVDPFYDAGADSHTSIMGNIGFGGTFYNGGKFPLGDGTNFDYEGQYATSFNRRQEGIIQYFSPNMNGFTFRAAVTSGRDNESTDAQGLQRSAEDLDPRIWSLGIAYETALANGDSIWGAITYQKHDDYTAWQLGARGDFDGGLFNPSGFEGDLVGGAEAGFGSPIACTDSDDEAWRIAGRYIRDWGNGQSTTFAAMYEQMEFDSDCVDTGTGGSTIWTDTERDSWMVSLKHNFAGPLDFRASYMDADDFDCGGGTGLCGTGGIFIGAPAGTTGGEVREDESDAKAFNLGLYYTMPAGTELRLTYSSVDNSDDSNYDFGIGGSNLYNFIGDDEDVDVDMWAIGMVQWF